MFTLGSFYGIAILSFLSEKKSSVEFFAIQPFISSFIGIIFIANIALAFSIFTPIRFYHLFIISILALVYIIFFLKKEDLQEILIAYSKNLGYIVTSSILSFLIINIKYDARSDMAIYHIQIAKYLHDYGLVKGLSFIMLQLGHQSAWFALPPLFEDFLKIYSSIIAGGFSIFISLCQFLRSLFRLSEDSDEVCLASHFLITIPILQIHLQVTSVETALNVLTGMTIFCSLKYYGLSRKTTTEISLSDSFFLYPAILLAISSLSMKLSGVPIFLLGIYLLLQSLRLYEYSYYSKILLISIFLILPRTIASFITSGCPFYPSSFLHFPVSWYIGSDVSRELVQHIIDYARWDDINPPVRTSTNWILPWLQRYTGRSVLYAVWVLIITYSVSVLIFKRNFIKLCAPLLPIAIFPTLGISYAFLTAPGPRFMLFHFASLIVIIHFALSKIDLKLTLLLTVATFSFTDLVNGNLKSGFLQIIALLLVMILDYTCRSSYVNLLTILLYASKVISFVIYFACFSLSSYHDLHSLIVPNTSSLIRQFKELNINGITFYQPVESSCGYGPLPCYSGNLPFAPPINEIELIEKEKGVAGGFKRKTTH